MRLEEFDRIAGGTPASWEHLDVEAMAAVNAAHLEPLRDRSWDDAVRLLDRTRAELLAALAAVPGEPAETWGPAHPLGRALRALVTHDREHADQVKNARIAG